MESQEIAPDAALAETQSVHEVIFDLLEADTSLMPAAKEAVLEALTEVVGEADPEEQHAPEEAFLTSITVAGFRGVGPEARLDLYPAPGLTVVSGRNGSGKSSFAEALEFALTGTSYRWHQKEVLWAESWRNLHHPNPCEIRIGLTQQGNGPLTIGMEWAPGDSLADRKSWTQVSGQKQIEGTESLSWARPLELYRPMLSYGELGRLFDSGPSGLYDALAKLLGLDVLNDADKNLATRLKDTKLARDHADAERKRITSVLDGSTDERAHQATALLAKKKSIDLDALLSLATGSGDEQLTTVRLLRDIATLQAPVVDDITATAHGLRTAVAAVANTTTSLVDLTEQRLNIVQAALRFFEEAGDSDCPACGQGHLDSAWAQHARDSVTASEAAVAEYRAATHHRKTARAAALAMAGAVATAAVVDCVDLPSLSGYNAAVTAVQPLPDDDLALADHLETTLTDVAAAAESLREEAAAAVSERESAWAPLAAQLGAWVQMERDAQQSDAAIATLTAAKRWVSTHGVKFRNLRIEPIAAQARWIWSRLRQESNVDLGEITLEGTNTRRRAIIGGTVDGKPTKALSVMSQGELHALALALFLPRATAGASPFRFVVLDDPIQAMDPAKIDGFVAVLTELAKTHQVIVFSHDDRLASVIRETGRDARMVEVIREAGSKVTIRDNVNPALRQVADVFALIKDDDMPEEAKRRAIPALFRLSVEAAAKQSYFGRKSLDGTPREEWETRWQEAKKTRNRIALAVADDAQADITSWLDADAVRKNTLKICNAGVHGASGKITIYDARDLEKTVNAVLALK